MFDNEEESITYPRVVIKQMEPEDENQDAIFGGIEFGEEEGDFVCERLGYADDLDEDVTEAYVEKWRARAATIGLPFDNELPELDVLEE